MLGNKAGKGGGIVTEGSDETVLMRTLIAGNTAKKAGGAFIRSRAYFADVLIANNHATSRAGGIEGNPGTRLSMARTVIANNTLRERAANCALKKPFTPEDLNVIGITMVRDGQNPNAHSCLPTGGWAVTGAVVMMILVICYHRFYWWPIHPIGYLTAYSSAMRILWFSFFVGWLCNALCMRYGGVGLFKKLRNFFIGLIIGDFLMAGSWAIYGLFSYSSYLVLRQEGPKLLPWRS